MQKKLFLNSAKLSLTRPQFVMNCCGSHELSQADLVTTRARESSELSCELRYFFQIGPWTDFKVYSNNSMNDFYFFKVIFRQKKSLKFPEKLRNDLYLS